MVLDYKNVTFSFEAKKRKKRLKKIRLLLVLIFIISIFLILSYLQQLKRIKNIQSLLLHHKLIEAQKIFEKSENSIFHKKSLQELKALLYLFEGQLSEAEPIFKKQKKVRTAVQFRNFLNYFSDNSEYKKLKIYTDYLSNRGEDVLFFKVLYKTAYFDFIQSGKILNQLSDKIKKKNTKALKKIEKTNLELKSGKFNYIFDIGNTPLAYYDFKKKKTISLTPGIHFDEFTPPFRQGIKFYKLTINHIIQTKVHTLFKNFYGSMLIFNLKTNGITVAYSKSKIKKGKNTVFSQEYEPGSIIKVLTLFTYLQNSKVNIFPMECKGFLGLKNNIFYDRMSHGTVKSSLQALAISCNIAFAKMALELGFDDLSKVFNKFYFNSSGIQDLFCHFRTGSFKTNISQDIELANFGVGLNEINITTFHSALIPVIIAQHGSIYEPHLIKNIKNILDLGFYNHVPVSRKIFNDSTIFPRIIQAMVRVIEDKNGTGRRSKVEFVQAAIKTGTAGNKKEGLDAILFGFYPVQKPQYAFALRLENAGKAEYKGAFFLKQFLETCFVR